VSIYEVSSSCRHALNHHCQRTHTHPFNGPLSGTTQVSRYQKGKTNLDFTEARDSGWQWHQHMQVCTSLKTDNNASTPPLSYLQAGCPSCRPTNSVKALKAVSRLHCQLSSTIPGEKNSRPYCTVDGRVCMCLGLTGVVTRSFQQIARLRQCH